MTQKPPASRERASPDKFIWTVSPNEENERLDCAIARHIETASRAQAKKWIEQNRVSVNGKPVRPSRILHRGETVLVAPPPIAPAEPEPEPIPLDICYEDEDLLVLNKPPGMVMHPSPGHHSGTLVHALLHHCPTLSGIGGVARPGIVHRLDRGTSGLLVVAKHDVAHRRLAEQFAARTVSKQYLALVYGIAPEQFRMDNPIGRDVKNRQKISSRTRRARIAATEAERLELLPMTSMLSVQLETGRTHQIRVHLSEAGFPVVGDTIYGPSQPPHQGPIDAALILKRLKRPALHATRLTFHHPDSGELLQFEVPLAEDILEVVEELRQL